MLNVVVNITNVDRWHLLRQAIAPARLEGFDRAVVSDNCANADITRLAVDEFGDFVDVFTVGRNTGTAGGLKTGMQRALDIGADFVMLLDDDNELQSGCLAALASAHPESAVTVPLPNLAVLAYQSVRQTDVAANLPANGREGNRAAFFGFHLLDVSFKIFRRTPIGRRWIAERPMLPRVVVAIAPYSGMYFHRSALEIRGLLDEPFSLYVDDTDFTFRLAQAWGEIVLCTQAKLVGLEILSNVKARLSNIFDAWFLEDADIRAFYSTRNNAHFERQTAGNFWLIRSVNRAIQLIALRVDGVFSGEAGRLGEHSECPLQQSALSVSSS